MNKQRGSIAIIVLVLIIMALVGAVGYLVYDKNKSETSNNSAPAPTVVDNTNKENDKNINYTIRFINADDIEAALTIASEQDVAKLPTDFPEGARAYLLKSITEASVDNTPDCQSNITVTKYNDVNVAGGIGSTCGGGAAAVWSVGQDGVWQELYFQDSPTCDDLLAKKIYSEFIDTCYKDKNADDQFTEDEYIDNPNGPSSAL